METSSATQEVIQDQDAQAAKALAECDSLLSNAASDVGIMCQGLHDTFPCLEDSVPAIEGPQAAYTLEPAGMLELQVYYPTTLLCTVLLNAGRTIFKQLALLLSFISYAVGGR